MHVYESMFEKMEKIPHEDSTKYTIELTKPLQQVKDELVYEELKKLWECALDKHQYLGILAIMGIIVKKV